MRGGKTCGLIGLCLLTQLAYADANLTRNPATQEATASEDSKEFNQDLEDAEKKGPGNLTSEPAAKPKAKLAPTKKVKAKKPKPGAKPETE